MAEATTGKETPDNISAARNSSRQGFHHFTFNTGHNMFQDDRYFQPDEIVKSRLWELVQESLQPGGTKVIGNLSFEAVKEGDIYTGTVFSNVGGKKIPVLTTSGARTEEAGKKLWATLQKRFHDNPAVVRMEKCRPHAPFVADLIFDCCYLDVQALDFFITGMSGDFCKCIGWAFLFPEVFDGCHDLPDEDAEAAEEKAFCTQEQQKPLDRCGMAASYEVGRSYMDAVGHQEGVFFDIDDCGATLDIFFSNVTGRELSQIESGAPLEMKLVQLRGVIFVLLKFGDLNWVDAPYSVHLSKNLTRLDVPVDGCGLSMHVSLFDTTTGQLLCNRLLSMSTVMSRKLIEMVEEQKRKPFSRADYNDTIRSIYAAYRTKELVRMAFCSHRWK